jgi:hypothetical protein
MYLLLVSSCSLYCVHVDITQSFMKGLRFYPTYYLVSISWVLAKDMRTLGQRLERLFPLARAVARASCWHWFRVPEGNTGGPTWAPAHGTGPITGQGH